jgi:nucleotide-binding universal stress UspA family protein
VLDVLAYSSDFPVWTPGVRYAAELAANLGAALTGIHVAQPWPSREPRGAPPSLMAELLAHAQEEVRAAMQAGALFDAWARGLGVGSATWHVALGDPAEAIGIAGNWNDLVVFDRRIGDLDGTSDLICRTLLSGCACIAVPDKGHAPPRFDRVFVVFDGSPGAIRALHASMPLLERAARVIVLAIERFRDGANETWACAFDPNRWLHDRGIRSELQEPQTESGTAEAILETASQNRADLLVCGVRGKRQFGECRLDERSLHLLTCSGIPLLMAGRMT